MGSTRKPTYRVDTSRWPLVLLIPAETAADPAVFYAALDAVMARNERFVGIFDLRGGGSDPAKRRRFIAWMNAHRSTIRTLVVAFAVVAGSALEHGFVTAALWLATPPCPMRVFADDKEAEAWLFSMYAASKTEGRGST